LSVLPGARIQLAMCSRTDMETLDLVAGCARVVRSWDHRGRKFVEPKTKAGARVVPL
jgi:hypothetical protein